VLIDKKRAAPISRWLAVPGSSRRIDSSRFGQVVAK
jgi:hypothetical protein